MTVGSATIRHSSPSPHQVSAATSRPYSVPDTSPTSHRESVLPSTPPDTWTWTYENLSYPSLMPSPLLPPMPSTRHNIKPLSIRSQRMQNNPDIGQSGFEPPPPVPPRLRPQIPPKRPPRPDEVQLSTPSTDGVSSPSTNGMRFPPRSSSYGSNSRPRLSAQFLADLRQQVDNGPRRSPPRNSRSRPLLYDLHVAPLEARAISTTGEQFSFADEEGNSYLRTMAGSSKKHSVRSSQRKPPMWSSSRPTHTPESASNNGFVRRRNRTLPTSHHIKSRRRQSLNLMQSPANLPAKVSLSANHLERRRGQGPSDENGELWETIEEALGDDPGSDIRAIGRQQVYDLDQNLRRKSSASFRGEEERRKAREEQTTRDEFSERC